MLASHRIRLDPAPAQAGAFHRRAGHARTAYHWAVRALRAGLAAGEWRDAKTLRPMFINAVMGRRGPCTTAPTASAAGVS